jgi:hypothetical protein
MECKSMKVATVAGLSALYACAGMGREERREPVERLDEHGISARILEVEAGSVVKAVAISIRSHAPAAGNWRVVP